MMRGSAPKRWLDDGGGGLSSERDVLRSGLNVEPPPGQKDAVWAAIIGGFPPGGGSGAGSGGAKATAAKGIGGAAKALSLASGGVIKGVLLATAGAALLVGGYAIVSAKVAPKHPIAMTAPSDARPTADSSLAGNDPDFLPLKAPQREAIAESEPSTTDEPAHSARSAEVGSPSASSAPTAGAESAQATQFEEASNALFSARAALRGGNATGALAELEAMRTRFPPDVLGRLGQERELLTIEALYKSGQRAQAKARAEAFLRASPHTIYAARIEPFTR
jgi:hypothetical protein